ncbi:MAG: TAXI family TRAP transporter solute-binding subunit [Proteobacteria bacterium]|nr:TAXI family TRAP transporter solute-binding subunit [Pseudomonadota bacterium]
MLSLNTLCRRTTSQVWRCGWWQEANVCRGKSGQVLVVPLAVILFLASCLSTQAFTPFRIGTGGSTGVYYPVGKLIATGLTVSATKDPSVLQGFIGVAQNSAGSIENVRAVIAGELEAGMVQADIAALAYNRQGDFADLLDAENVRAIAGLYSEKFQLVMRKDAGVNTYGDLKGKRISVDEIGSGTRVITNIVLQAHGMSEQDLLPLYLKPAFTEDKMKNGQLQGFAIMAGAPNAAVSKLLDTGITILPIDPSVAAAISQQYKYLAPGKISKGTYRDVPETPTLEVYALLIVGSKMSDDMAYAVTESLFSQETIKLLQEGHPLGKAITLDSALLGVSIPLHPGAERFYRDRGMVQQ